MAVASLPIPEISVDAFPLGAWPHFIGDTTHLKKFINFGIRQTTFCVAERLRHRPQLAFREYFTSNRSHSVVALIKFFRIGALYLVNLRLAERVEFLLATALGQAPAIMVQEAEQQIDRTVRHVDQ